MKRTSVHRKPSKSHSECSLCSKSISLNINVADLPLASIASLADFPETIKLSPPARMNTSSEIFHASCPPALERLLDVDQFMVTNYTGSQELFRNRQGPSFQIKTTGEGELFYAMEESNKYLRWLCCSLRPFRTKLIDNYEIEAMNFYRPYRCPCCCCEFCYLQKIEVCAPPGTKIGLVRQVWNLWKTPSYVVENAAGTKVLKLRGRHWSMCCVNLQKFKILTAKGNNVIGEIDIIEDFIIETKKRSVHLGATFPRHLDVRLKAILIAACILLDYNHFGNLKK